MSASQGWQERSVTRQDCLLLSHILLSLLLLCLVLHVLLVLLLLHILINNHILVHSLSFLSIRLNLYLWLCTLLPTKDVHKQFQPYPIFPSSSSPSSPSARLTTTHSRVPKTRVASSASAGSRVASVTGEEGCERGGEGGRLGRPSCNEVDGQCECKQNVEGRR